MSNKHITYFQRHRAWVQPFPVRETVISACSSSSISANNLLRRARLPQGRTGNLRATLDKNALGAAF